jgi:hypothetical protein
LLRKGDGSSEARLSVLINDEEEKRRIWKKLFNETISKKS